MTQRLRDDKRGSVAIIFALTFTAIFGMVEIAVDYGRISSVSTKMTAALDRAALAGAKLIDEDNVTEADVMDRAEAFFKSQVQILNIPIAAAATFNAVVDLDKGSVTASAQARSCSGRWIPWPSMRPLLR